VSPKSTSKKIQAIDLFCGAGGLSYGLQKAGIEVLAGIDLDPICRYPFETNINAKFIEKDISLIKGSDLAALYSKGTLRLLAGCAPCQPFSTYCNGRDSSKDLKWGLLKQFARLVGELEPELVTMENVPGVKKHEPFDEFINALHSCGYSVDTKAIYCQHLGIPQNRRRFVLLASRIGEIKFDIVAVEKALNVREAIGHLPPLKAGETHPADPLHKTRGLSPLNLKRIRESRQGGTWLDWPMDLRAACHLREKGASFKNVYSRMSWDKPAPTITTQSFSYGTGRFGHPDQDRAISLREAAILQTFPDDYKFVPKGGRVILQRVGRLIGNAVPPKLGEAIGSAFIKHIKMTFFKKQP
jgi:DNA (cytosine-5)-methyltransferase 1